MTTISLRLEDTDAQLIKEYAGMKKMTVSELIRQTVLERIEEEFDLHAYKKAAEAFQADPSTYTHKEVGRLLEVER